MNSEQGRGVGGVVEMLCSKINAVYYTTAGFGETDHRSHWLLVVRYKKQVLLEVYRKNSRKY